MVSIAVPIIPKTIATISLLVNLSLIIANASKAAKMGPVVKLMQLERVNGM